MEAWTIIVSSIGGSVSLTAALSYLLREWISTRLRASIEREYDVKQAQLKAELDGKLEGVRAGYQRVLDENRIRFSKLYEEQANTVKRLYQLTVRVEEAISRQTSDWWTAVHGDDPSPDPVRQEAARILAELRTEFKEHRILLPDALCGSIQNIITTAAMACVMEDIAEFSGDGTSFPEARKRAFEQMVSEFEPLRTELEQFFRQILGVACPAYVASVQGKVGGS